MGFMESFMAEAQCSMRLKEEYDFEDGERHEQIFPVYMWLLPSCRCWSQVYSAFIEP